jgi:hypothetical protein
LKRHGPGGIDIAIVEPSDTHYYQPAFTLVGAGLLIDYYGLREARKEWQHASQHFYAV